MPGASPIQASFNTGELSELMRGRVDFDRYRSALAYCKNLIPLTQGPITRRPGTYFCDEVKDSTRATRIVGFKYSTTQAFAIEFGHQYVRFKKNHAPIYDLTLTITGITAANPPVLTYAGTDPSNGDHVDVSGVAGMVEVNNRRFLIAGVDTGANTFQLKELGGTFVDAVNYTAYTSGGAAQRVYTLTTTYLEVDLFELKFVQSADVLYIFHVDYPPKSLSRTSDAVWVLTSLTFLDGPYLPLNTTTTTMTPGASAPGSTSLTTGPAGAATGMADNGAGLIRVTDSAHGYTDGIRLLIAGAVGTTEANGVWVIRVITANTYDLIGSTFVNAWSSGGTTHPAVFADTDVGRYIRVQQGSVWGYALITAFTDESEVTITIINTLTSTAAKVNWRMGLWSDTTGYPAAGTFFGDRLYTGGTPVRPERIDGSKVGDYLNMASTDTVGAVTDDNAVSYNLNSDDVQTIRWMKGTANGVVIGTFEGEWLVSPSALGEAITPTNINAKQSQSNGSTDTQAVKVGNAVLHIAAGGRELYELTYSFNDNSLDAFDMTVLAEHITKGPLDATSGIREMAYQKKRTKVIWCVRQDGVLLGFSYSRADKVTGWHRHELGGYSNAGHTAQAKVESVTVIPTSDGLRDEVWLVVQRYINGRSVRLNEFMTRLWEHGDAQEDAFFCDAGLTYDGTATTTIGGLHHLAGETVSLLVDGAAHPNRTVSATGTLTLDRSASVVQIGYAYNSDGQSLRPEAGAAQGTAQGKTMRTHRVFFRLLDTLGLQVGPTFNTTGYGKLTEITFRQTSDPMSAAVPLFTGDVGDFSWEQGYNTENYVCWRHHQLFPGTVIAVMPDLDLQER